MAAINVALERMANLSTHAHPERRAAVNIQRHARGIAERKRQSSRVLTQYSGSNETAGTFAVRTLLLLLAVQGPFAGLYLTLFTELGYGATVFNLLAARHELLTYVEAAAGVLFVVVYMLDVRSWQGPHGERPHPVVWYTIVLITFGTVVMGALLSLKSHPYVTTGLSLVGLPLVYWWAKIEFWPTCHPSGFLKSVSVVNVIAGVAVLAYTVNWAGTDSVAENNLSGVPGGAWWGLESQVRFKNALRVYNADRTVDVEDSACYAKDTCDEFSPLWLNGSAVDRFDVNGASYFAEDSACATGFRGKESTDVDAWPYPVCQQANYTLYGVTGAIGEGTGLMAGKTYQTFCTQTNESLPYPWKELDYCMPAFVLWGTPLIASIGWIIFGILSGIMGHAMGNMTHVADGMEPSTRMFLWSMLISLMALLVSAQIAGASMKLAEMVKFFGGLLVLINMVMLGQTLGWHRMEQQLSNIAIMGQISAAGGSDWMKAVCLLFGGVEALLCFFVLSAINQTIRKALGVYRMVEEQEKSYTLTKAGHRQWQKMVKYHWASVFEKMVVVGLMYFIFAVGVSKVVMVLLSILNGTLQSIFGSYSPWSRLSSVTFIYCCVGLLMFLMPPVPGLPVYLTGGIVLTKAACPSLQDEAGTSVGADGAVVEDLFGFWGGVTWGCVWAFIVKYMAISFQQKIIGQKLGNRVSVRKFVGINSMTIKSIRAILSKPGVSLSKIYILVGGPDWPTSVLTGILRLSLVQMLLASTPFAVTISVTVAAGALMLRTDAEMEAIGAATMGLAALVQVGCTFLATMTIAAYAKDNKEELSAFPRDEEVYEAEKIEYAFVLSYRRATQWTKLPGPQKVLLTTAAVMMHVVTVMFANMGGSLFAAVEVTTPFGEEHPPLYGSFANIATPLGRYPLVFFTASLLIFYIVYKPWAKGAATKDVEASTNPSENE